MRSTVAVALAMLGLLVAPTALLGASGPPLTKEQYLTASVRFHERVSKAENATYYEIALQDYSPAKCARKVRRFHRDLARIAADAREVVPPAEIQDLHLDLLVAGDRVVRLIGKTARPVARGKLDCGDGAASRLYEIHKSSPIDRIHKQLADLGYVPSGA
jgi:hypothetical protein